MAPLHVAAGKGRLAVVRLLLDRGADAQARGKDEETPLDYAARNLHGLLERGIAAEGQAAVGTLLRDRGG